MPWSLGNSAAFPVRVSSVSSLRGEGERPRIYKSRRLFEQDLDGAFDRASLNVPGPVRKEILSALAERDEIADICTDAKGKPEPDSDLRDYENIPLKEDVAAYFEREVRPHVPDAWIAGVELHTGKGIVVDESKVRVGYEIPVTRHFYKYRQLRSLAEIEGEIMSLERDIQGMLGAVIK